MKWVIGVDEAGRGPLAGPVAVGVVSVPIDFDWSLIPGVGDSKKLSPENREAIFRLAKELRRSGKLDFRVAMTGAEIIDRKGIVPAINSAKQRALRKLQLDPSVCVVKLDGGLRAPVIYELQETIIKGDQSEPVIGLASIVAKVTRDRFMLRIAEQFHIYDFSSHKGYGTKFHREIIKVNGLCVLHRRTFCKNLIT